MHTKNLTKLQKIYEFYQNLFKLQIYQYGYFIRVIELITLLQ
jgi:hypothetical protein